MARNRFPRAQAVDAVSSLRFNGSPARCPQCGSTSVQVLVLPRHSLGMAALGEFLFGTAAGNAAGSSHQLANACAACGAAWQPGTASEDALRQHALSAAAYSDFDATRFLRRCSACIAEIPLPATTCTYCSSAQDPESIRTATEHARGVYLEARASLPAKLAEGPIVAKCSVCLRPLREPEVKMLKQRPLCDEHFTKAIG